MRRVPLRMTRLWRRRRGGQRDPHPEEVRARRALVRCFLRNGIDREQWMADLVLPIVQEALEARDRELARLARRSSCCGPGSPRWRTPLDPRPLPCLPGRCLNGPRAGWGPSPTEGNECV